jgi:hypothetical protein
VLAGGAMTKTAYAQRLSDEELAEHAKDMTPKEREEFRIENATSPLFDMWLRFEGVFGDRAIDRLDISDEDAEAAAKGMEGHGPAGDAFAYLLRSIPNRRRLREISHKVNAVWAAAGTSEPMSIPEIHERYAKLPKGDA